MRTLLVLLVLSVLLTGCSGGHKAPAAASPCTAAPSPAPQGVQVCTGLSHDHLGPGQYPHEYPQSPPVGGPHSAAWLKCGVYTQPLPKENAVHSMEHGAVWITYDTDLPPATVTAVVQLAKLSPTYVLISPYSGQSSPVVATTWGLQLRVQSANDPRLVAFIKLYAGGNQGGEAGAGCSNGATLQQALDYDRSLS